MPSGIYPRKKTGKIINCLICNKEFETCPARIKVGRGKYCSNKCYGVSKENKPSWNKGIPNSGFKQGYTPWNKGKRGEITSNWKGGINPINLSIRTSFEYQIWRKKIFERDDYVCQICGERGGNLRANHIKKFSDYPELRLIENNGITLCKNCDLRWVFHHEPEWESYFNFNLETRNKISL